ncbi:hypothetical protein E2C01_100999 [Portunus trituberculatus]|uniref:Uncharacterized protein n=1 Tax=Portunus trituberculatus TaxID=210409 RepID=A0A5B7KF06_PORTR|nr:hypothetical protein [Portunus trituberculatus]
MLNNKTIVVTPSTQRLRSKAAALGADTGVGVMVAASDGCGGDGGRAGKVPDQEIKGRPLRVAALTQGDVSLRFVLLGNVTLLCECDESSPPPLNKVVCSGLASVRYVWSQHNL